MALVAGLVAFAILDPPLGVIVLAVSAVIEIGEAIFWRRYLRRIRVRTGVEALVGERAEVISECRPVGQVRFRGEIWRAECERGAGPGETVRITAIEGLTLKVEPAGGSGGEQAP